ncbi:RluA family pseudouridine synthase [Loigolactobacillus zhaoyuanensis]|uniref:RluA family pseudouridine synthase n=1 Tax=Loigolactobacillus zhaoyuanensis TaxID=2486017 RepID=UPI000F749E1D|nr:RluA family pseudouridine synthase [Loigolactobacillus zhaoyuanensis]
MQFSWRNQGVAIKVALFLQHQGFSKRLLQQLKYHGQTWINGQPCRLIDQLPASAQIQIKLPAESGDPLAALSSQPLNILYETADWLVLNKPANVASVPGPQTGTDTIVSRVRGYLLRQHSENVVPHLMSRLDYGTSGVLLVAKHAFAQSRATTSDSLMREKIYLALVAGTVKAEHGMISLPIGRRSDQIAGIIDLAGKTARTEFWRQAYLPELDATLLKVSLHTGRRHQIRIHCQAIGHPSLGDSLYGGPMNLEIQRPALHAWQLIFNDPFTQRKQKITAPLPTDLQNLLKSKHSQ